MIRVALKRAARIKHEAGEIVEVTPAVADFLVAVGSAEVIQVEKEAEKPQKRRTKKS